jgi:hypothetical protein
MDTGNHDRVRKMRQNRKKAGFTETNVWIPSEVRQAIDQKIVEGEFPTRRMAIIHALEKAYKPTKTEA